MIGFAENFHIGISIHYRYRWMILSPSSLHLLLSILCILSIPSILASFPPFLLSILSWIFSSSILTYLPLYYCLPFLLSSFYPLLPLLLYLKKLTFFKSSILPAPFLHLLLFSHPSSLPHDPNIHVLCKSFPSFYPTCLYLPPYLLIQILPYINSSHSPPSCNLSGLSVKSTYTFPFNSWLNVLPNPLEQPTFMEYEALHSYF